jgi:hypothetical protein
MGVLNVCLWLSKTVTDQTNIEILICFVGVEFMCDVVMFDAYSNKKDEPNSVMG